MPNIGLVWSTAHVRKLRLDADDAPAGVESEVGDDQRLGGPQVQLGDAPAQIQTGNQLGSHV